MSEIDPATALSAVLWQDHATFAFLIQERREPIKSIQF